MSRLFSAIAAACALLVPALSRAEPVHGIAMHGEAKLPRGFTHFPYVNPDAPKGGRITLGVTGSFDSVNPLIIRGEPVQGIREFVVESLLARSQDEPFALYGLVAESIEAPSDRSSVTFNLDKRAKFSDGKPITADDVIFSMELLRDKGKPNHRTYYKKIAETVRVSDHAVRFVFKPAESAAGTSAGTAASYDREMPLIMGLMPVLPKHATNPEAFEKSSLTPMIGSGPYKISAIDPGRSITYTRDPSYWGRDLPVNRGRFNFGEVRYDYYREPGTQFEAFKVGQVDFRGEDDPSRWAERYNIAAVDDGRIVRAELPSGLPAGMNALVFNLRRDAFKDQQVRQALIKLYNFEWTNRTLFNNLYKRTQSYFERSFLASVGAADIRPADARERALLDKLPPDIVKPGILDGTWRLPVSDGSGHNRDNARQAFEMLKAAGYALTDGKLVHPTKGPLAFEILTSSAAQERQLSTFLGDLKRIGIDARLRVVDSAQYQARLKDYDYDMIQYAWPTSLSPGNEQLYRWSSPVADTPGSFNYAGVKSPAVDAMIAAMLSAVSLEDFTSAVRALDRVLLSGDYVIPLYHMPTQWVAHWKRLKHPEQQPLFGLNLDSWWIADDAASASPPQ